MSTPELRSDVTVPQPTLRVFNPSDTRVELHTHLCPVPVVLKPRRWNDVPRQVAMEYCYLKRGESPQPPEAWQQAQTIDFIVDFGPENPRSPDPRLLPLPALTYASVIDSATGYGHAAERLMAHLAPYYDLHPWPLAYWNKEHIAEESKRILTREHQPTEWALAFTIPPELPRVPARNRVLFSMWEANTPPHGEAESEKWVELVNTWAQALIVPCAAQRLSWLHAGTRVPIYVAPLGVDFDTYTYHERDHRGETFTVLCYGALTSRKSPIEAIYDVCHKAFQGVDDWLLILKTRNGLLGAGQFWPIIQDPNVEIINQDYPPAQMAQLCHQADVGLVLSRYEGWGLPAREMMATGLPVILSANSGHLEDCDFTATYNVPIPDAAWEKAPGAGGGSWAVPDYARAADKLRQLYEAWKAGEGAQSDMGRRAAKWIRGRRTWEQSARAVHAILERVTNNA